MEGISLGMFGEAFFRGASRAPVVPLPMRSPLATWARPVSRSGLRVTWLGHSTLLLEIDGVRILTDPVFGDRASPVSFAGGRRFHLPPARIADLPRLDAVLLSHDHYDHLCVRSLREIRKLGVPVVTSLGVGARLEALGYDASLVTELDWWEEQTLPGGAVSLRATPAQHFSGRSLTDRNRTLWSSWVIATAKRRLFFSGDTGPAPEFEQIRERLGPFELVMLEIGAWHPAWGQIHLGPANALRAFEALGGGTLMPIHWGTFDLALHTWEEPAETLYTLAEAAGARLLTPMLGRPVEPEHVDRADPWWRALQSPARVSESPAPGASIVAAHGSDGT